MWIWIYFFLRVGWVGVGGSNILPLISNTCGVCVCMCVCVCLFVCVNVFVCLYVCVVVVVIVDDLSVCGFLCCHSTAQCAQTHCVIMGVMSQHCSVCTDTLCHNGSDVTALLSVHRHTVIMG